MFVLLIAVDQVTLSTSVTLATHNTCLACAAVCIINIVYHVYSTSITTKPVTSDLDTLQLYSTVSVLSDGLRQRSKSTVSLCHPEWFIIAFTKIIMIILSLVILIQKVSVLCVLPKTFKSGP